jgi:hypothetical protein
MIVRLILDDGRSRTSKVFFGEYYYYQREVASQRSEKNLLAENCCPLSSIYF